MPYSMVSFRMTLTALFSAHEAWRGLSATAELLGSSQLGAGWGECSFLTAHQHKKAPPRVAAADVRTENITSGSWQTQNVQGDS